MLSDNATLAVGLTRADAALRRRLTAPLKAAHGLAFTEFQLLAELDAVQGARLRAGDLAQRLMLSAGGVTRAAAPLLESGLLAREADARDARAGYLLLTSAGKARLDAAEETVDRVVGETLAGVLTRTDRLALLGLFERLGY